MEAKFGEVDVFEAEIVGEAGEASRSFPKASGARPTRTAQAQPAHDSPRPLGLSTAEPNVAVVKATARTTAPSEADIMRVQSALPAVREARVEVGSQARKGGVNLSAPARSARAPRKMDALKAGAGVGVVLLAAGFGLNTMRSHDATSGTSPELVPLQRAVGTGVRAGGSVSALVPVAAPTMPSTHVRVRSLLSNPSFEGVGSGGLDGWVVADNGSGAIHAIHGTRPEDAHAGRCRLSFFNLKPYKAAISQTVSNLKPGLYSLSAWIKRSGGQAVATMSASGTGSRQRVMVVPHGVDFHPITIRNIRVSSGQCTVAFATQAQGGQWMDLDHVELLPQKK